jgi:hypothetical protein
MKLIAEASFLFFEASVIIGRKYLQQNGTLTEREQTEMALPIGYLADSGMFTLTRGLMVHQMLKRQPFEEVVTFTVFSAEEPEYEDIGTPFNLLLKGQILSCTLTHLAGETITLNGHGIQGDVYTLAYATVAYGWATEWALDILMDARGIPLRYPYHFVYTDRLEQYAHRPEPKPGQG